MAKYVEGILQEDERIAHRAAIHWVVYLPAAFLAVLAAILLLWFGPAAYRGSGGFLAAAGAIAGLAALAAAPIYFLKGLIQRTTTELAITDRRVIAKIGLIRRRTWEINAAKVEGVEVDQSIWGRIFGYGTVTVKGTGGGIAPIRNIDDPVEFRKHVTLL